MSDNNVNGIFCSMSHSPGFFFFLPPLPSLEGRALIANNRKQPKCQKKIKLVNFSSAAIETWINSYFFREGMATWYMKPYRVLSSLNFHLTGILEPVILIKSPPAKAVHLKACTVV